MGRDRVLRGFTLVELMVAVAIIAVAATLATVNYTKFVWVAHSAEAKAMMAAIEVGEESHRSSTLTYLSCSSALTDYYPHATPDDKKWSWINASHPDFASWNSLHVTSSGAGLYVYAVVAGAPGAAPPAVVPGMTTPPVWPVPTEPWFVVHAAGDVNGNGVRSSFVASSFDHNVYFENDDE